MKRKESTYDKTGVAGAPTAELESLVGPFTAGRPVAAEKQAWRLIMFYDKVPVLQTS